MYQDTNGLKKYKNQNIEVRVLTKMLQYDFLQLH